jgi:cytochrome c oxidase cbb3-type subunit 3
MYEDEYGAEAEKQRAYLKKIEGSSYAQILSNPDMMAFVRSYAKTLFGDNCAVCHQAGGTGVVGHYPNLADDSWLWGGTVREIQHTITAGHHGFMPSFRPTFSDAQAHDVAEYVLSLSGTKGGDEKAIMRGEKIFHGQEGGCYYCHGEKATGLISQGSANLTDHVWTIANVPAAKTYDEKVAAVEHVILHGVSRVMPTWQGRLSSTQIKLLTVYVHELGGGQ